MPDSDKMPDRQHKRPTWHNYDTEYEFIFQYKRMPYFNQMTVIKNISASDQMPMRNQKNPKLTNYNTEEELMTDTNFREYFQDYVDPPYYKNRGAAR